MDCFRIASVACTRHLKLLIGMNARKIEFERQCDSSKISSSSAHNLDPWGNIGKKLHVLC